MRESPLIGLLRQGVLIERKEKIEQNWIQDLIASGRLDSFLYSLKKSVLTYPVFFTTVEGVYLKVRRYDVISRDSSCS